MCEDYECADLFADSDFVEKTGINAETFAKRAPLVEYDPETKVAHFYPTKTKGFLINHPLKNIFFSFSGKSFSNFIESVKFYRNPKISDLIETVKKYTFHDTFYCTKVNLLLAGDAEDLKEEAKYIKQLQNAIFTLAKKCPVTIKATFRGMHISEKEFKAYPLKELIYIPSFLSTSKNEEKFYRSTNNCLIEIKLNNVPNNAIAITEELSIYAEEEEEVLFGCYSKFRIQEKQQNFNYKGSNFEYFIRLEHINEPSVNLDQGTILMLNFLGF